MPDLAVGTQLGKYRITGRRMDRFKSAAEMLEALEDVLKAEPPAAIPAAAVAERPQAANSGHAMKLEFRL